jgi:hypothetical protein
VGLHPSGAQSSCRGGCTVRFDKVGGVFCEAMVAESHRHHVVVLISEGTLGGYDLARSSAAGERVVRGG